MLTTAVTGTKKLRVPCNTSATDPPKCFQPFRVTFLARPRQVAKLLSDWNTESLKKIFEQGSAQDSSLLRCAGTGLALYVCWKRRRPAVLP